MAKATNWNEREKNALSTTIGNAVDELHALNHAIEIGNLGEQAMHLILFAIHSNRLIVEMREGLESMLERDIDVGR